LVFKVFSASIYIAIDESEARRWPKQTGVQLIRMVGYWRIPGRQFFAGGEADGNARLDAMQQCHSGSGSPTFDARASRYGR